MELSAELWSTLSPLLDQVLDLEPAARADWLEALGSRQPQWAEILRKLLAVSDSSEGRAFMQRPGLLRRVLNDERASELKPGDTIGPYRIEHQLGRGGMGTVWFAERTDGALKRHVALKLPLIPGEPQMRERLLRERDVLAALEHPHIARLYDAGLDASGRPYLALEYIEGQPIDVYCRDAGLDIKARLRVFAQAARAVAYAHARLTLHRDLKPTNILVTAEGEARLLDFGVAKLLEQGGTRETELTQIGGRALTPDYASPEQILGESLTVASDIYSLGVVLYQLLTGRRPYKLRRDSRGALEDAIVAAEPMTPSSAVDERASRRQLAGDLDTIVLKALKKRPADRYPTVAALVEDIDRYLSGRPILARADRAWYRARKFVLRNRVAVGAASATALALLVGAGLTSWQATVARVEADRAHEINRFILSLFDSASPNRDAPSDLRAVDLLKQARSRIESDLKGRADLQIELLATVGRSLYSLSANDEAQDALQRALDLGGPQAVLNPSPATTDAAIMLIDLLVIRGDYAQAEPLLDRWETALRARKPGLPLAHLLVDRSTLLLSTGRAREGVRPAREAVGLARTLSNVPGSETGELLFGLARAQYHADENEAALGSAREALTAFESPGSGARNGVIRAHALIARILRDLGRFDEAAASLGAELPHLKDLYGEHSQDYAVNLAEYAGLQDLRGDLESAAISIEGALSAVVGHNTTSERDLHIWEAQAGEIALQRRDFANARAHLQRALEHAIQSPLKKNIPVVEMLLWNARVLDGERAPMPDTLREPSADPAGSPAAAGAPVFLAGLQCTAGELALEHGELATAIGLFESGAKSFDAIIRKTLWFIAPWCLTRRGHALVLAGELDAAQMALQQAMQLHDARAVKTTPSRAETLVVLTELGLRRGRTNDALGFAREADAFWREYRPRDRGAAEAAAWLGRALIASGDGAGGRAELRRSETIRASADVLTEGHK